MQCGARVGLDEFDAIPEREILGRYPYALAAFADLHASLGNLEEARGYLHRALENQSSPAQQEKVRQGAKSIPLGEQLGLDEIGAIPWYSLVAVCVNGEEPPPWRLGTGPGMYRKSGWYLPIYWAFDGESTEEIQAELRKARNDHGFQPIHLG